MLEVNFPMQSTFKMQLPGKCSVLFCFFKIATSKKSKIQMLRECIKCLSLSKSWSTCWVWQIKMVINLRERLHLDTLFLCYSRYSEHRETPQDQAQNALELCPMRKRKEMTCQPAETKDFFWSFQSSKSESNFWGLTKQAKIFLCEMMVTSD